MKANKPKYLPVFLRVSFLLTAFLLNQLFAQAQNKESAAPPAYGNNHSVGKYINANGIRLYYEVYGKGEPLLMLHGNGGSIEAFATEIPELSKHYKIIAVDTRGQGKSSEDGKLYTYDLFAEDMQAFLDSLHLKSVNVFGWSDGGIIGLIMAMKYPKKVKKLAVTGANIFIDETVLGKEMLDDMKKDVINLSKDSSYAAKNSLRLNEMMLTEPRYTFESLAAIHCPVLVMCGENDLIKREHTKGIASHIKGSKLLIAPGGSHGWFHENPPLLYKTFKDFFGR